jgi:ParB family chromosome partitioning protein
MPSTLSLNTNEQAAQIALIENTHREALNPISEARAMQRLADEFQYTHDEVAVLLGISRTQVTNLIRLLRLDARIQHWMKQGALSEGHGKVLAGLPLENQYWYAS